LLINDTSKPRRRTYLLATTQQFEGALTMRLRTILTLALLVIATAAIAADDPIHQLDILGGKWQCKGTAYAFADMPEHPIVATTNGTWILGKSWLEIEYREMKNAKNKMP